MSFMFIDEGGIRRLQTYFSNQIGDVKILQSLMFVTPIMKKKKKNAWNSMRLGWGGDDKPDF